LDPTLQTLFVDPVERVELKYEGECVSNRWWNGFLIGKRARYRVIRGIADFIGCSCPEGPIFNKFGLFIRLWDDLWEISEIRRACKDVACFDGPLLEVAAGPGGGFVPGLLRAKPDLIILMSDIDIRVLEDWRCFSSKSKTSANDKIGRISLSFSSFDAQKMPLRDDSFSAVTSLGGFNNIDSNQVRAAKEAFRVLRSGGLLYVLEGWFSKEEISKTLSGMVNHIERLYPGLFGEEGLESIVRDAGFRVLERLEVSSPLLRYYSNQILDLLTSNRLEPKFTLLKAIKP